MNLKLTFAVSVLAGDEDRILTALLLWYKFHCKRLVERVKYICKLNNTIFHNANNLSLFYFGVLNVLSISCTNDNIDRKILFINKKTKT